MDRNVKENSGLSQELKCIAWEIVQNLWIVLALAISLSCLSYIAARISYSPIYTSSTTFVISKGGISSAYSNLQSAREMVPTFSSLVNSNLMQKRVAQDMGVDSLPGSIRVEAVPETNLVTISATSDRPDTAFQMVKSLMKVYPEVGDKALGEIIMEVFDQPEYPTHPDKAFAGGRVVRIAFLVTSLLVMGAMGVSFYLKDTVKSPDQARSKLDTQLFSVLYHEKQFRNLSDFLHNRRKSMRMSDPSVSFLYEETMKKVSTKLLYKLRGSGSQVLLITSTLPGEGKSTLAMNLAQDMSHRGKKVLLIEGDLQQPGLAQVLHLEELPPDWSEFLCHKKDPSPAMRYLKNYGFTVLLNSSPVPQSADWLAVSHLDQLIAGWKEQFDVILVDSPPVRRRADAEVWARCADCSLLVVRQNVSEAKYINDSIDMLNEYGHGLLGSLYNDAFRVRDFSSSGYGYGQYGSYGGYGGYGKYGSYGRYGSYGKYGKYSRNADSEHSGSDSQ